MKWSWTSKPAPLARAVVPTAVSRDVPARLCSLDCLRGAAILAIALANAPLFLGPAAGTGQPVPSAVTLLDQPAQAVLGAVAALHLYLWFALLFGYGLGVQLHRTATGGVGYVRARMVVLALLGLLHALVLWYGDILLTYALSGAVVVGLRDLRRCARLLLALGLLISVPLLVLAIATPAASDAPTATDLRRVDAQLAAYRSADLHRIVAQRLVDTRRQGAANLLAMPAIIALMLLGLEGARGPWPHRLAAWAQRQPIQVLLVLGGGLALTQGGAILAADGGATHVARVLGAPLTAVAVLAWLLGREHRGRRIPGQRTLAAVGRLSISSYVLQSLLCTSLAYGYGWGTYGTWSPSGMLLMAVAIATITAWVARAWLRHWPMGPVEWLWRAAARAGASVVQRSAANARHPHHTQP